MSLKFASPLVGYNNNVRYKGRVFHIQTEDSGAKYGHVMTHLFMDGGRILKSVKTSYAEHVGTERMADIVRDLMKQQHRSMAISLREGVFDALVLGTAPTSQETLAISSGAVPAASSVTPPDESEPSIPSSIGPPSERPASAFERRLSSVAPPPPASAQPPAVASLPERPRYNGPEALDRALVERAATVASGGDTAGSRSSTPASALRPSTDLPPPPANMLREKTAKGANRVAPGAAPPTVSPRPPSVRAQAPGPPASQTGRAVATTRPASAFGQARPQGQSIFGEDLMSDKSLDDAILTYLAGELESEKK